MNQSKPKQEVRTLSIRIPIELYVGISQHAIDKDLPSLNAAIIDLIESGITLIEERDSVISNFILEIVPRDTLENLINGTIVKT